MEHFTHFVSSVTTWLTLINPTVGASLIALIGVVLTLALNRRARRRQQFLDLRRDIYLAAADAFAASTQYLALLSQPEVKRSQGDQLLAAISGLVGKIHIVAGQQVLATVTKLHEELMRCYRALIIQKDELDEFIETQTTTSRELNRLSGAIDKIQQPAIPQVFQRIQYLEQHNRLVDVNIYKTRWNMIEKWNDYPEVLEPLTAAAILAMKKELGIKIDKEWYAGLSRDSAGRTVEEIRKYLVDAKGAQEAQMATMARKIEATSPLSPASPRADNSP
jgi:hypothetical protein